MLWAEVGDRMCAVYAARGDPLTWRDPAGENHGHLYGRHELPWNQLQTSCGHCPSRGPTSTARTHSDPESLLSPADAVPEETHSRNSLQMSEISSAPETKGQKPGREGQSRGMLTETAHSGQVPQYHLHELSYHGRPWEETQN